MWLQRPDSNRHGTAYEAAELPVLYSAICGGASRDRTGGLLLARQALSHLSYGPIGVHEWD